MKFKRRFWIRPSFSTESSDSAPAAGGEDLSALRSALEKERKRNDELAKKLKQREDAEALQNKSLQDQVTQLQQEKAALEQKLETQATEHQQQLLRRDVARSFSDALAAAKVLPEYRDRFGDLEQSLTVENGKLMQDGKPFDAASLRTKYPAMFAADNQAAGSGASGSNGSGGNGSARVISTLAETATVDPADLVSGKVVLE